MKINNIYALALFIVIVLLSSACKQDLPQNQNQSVYVQIAKDPERLSPIFFPYQTARQIYQNIFLPLADYHPFTLDLEPILITEIPQRNDTEEFGLCYDINLRPEVKWEDGADVTTADYLFTLKAIVHPKTTATLYRSILSTIDTVMLLDNYSMKVCLGEDSPLALETAVNFPIYPEHIYDADQSLRNYTLSQLKDEAWYTNQSVSDTMLNHFANQMSSQEYTREKVVGCGPYYLENWLPEEAVVLRETPGYWGANLDISALKQGPEQIIFKIIPDPLNALNQLESGLLDVIPNVDPDSYHALKSDSLDDSGLEYHDLYLNKLYFLALNNIHPVLKHHEVREAIAHAVDVDNMIDILENGFAKRTNGFINPTKSYYNDALSVYDFDLDKSRDLLEKNGWIDHNNNGVRDKVIDGKTQELEITYFASGKLGSDIGLLIKENTDKIGVNLNIVKQDYSITRKEYLYTGKYGIVVSVVTQNLMVDDLYPTFHSDNAVSGGSNTFYYENEEVDDILDEIKATSNNEIMDNAFKKLQEKLYEDVPFIPLYVPMTRIVNSKHWELKTSQKRPGYFPNLFTYKEVPVTK